MASSSPCFRFILLSNSILRLSKATPAAALVGQVRTGSSGPWLCTLVVHPGLRPRFTFWRGIAVHTDHPLRASLPFAVHGPRSTIHTHMPMIRLQTTAPNARPASRLMHHGPASRRPSVAYDSGPDLPPRISTTSPPSFPSLSSVHSQTSSSHSPRPLDFVWRGLVDIPDHLISFSFSFPSHLHQRSRSPPCLLTELPLSNTHTLICNLLCRVSRHA